MAKDGIWGDEGGLMLELEDGPNNALIIRIVGGENPAEITLANFRRKRLAPFAVAFEPDGPRRTESEGNGG